VPIAELDALISRNLATGMGDDGQAFEPACRELGGKVVEAGPGERRARPRALMDRMGPIAEISVHASGRSGQGQQKRGRVPPP
jgi:hypothetical protein